MGGLGDAVEARAEGEQDHTQDRTEWRTTTVRAQGLPLPSPKPVTCSPVTALRVPALR